MSGRSAVPLIVAVLSAAGCAADNGVLPSDSRAISTDGYPTFRANPTGARGQLSGNEAAAKIAALDRAGTAAASGPPPSNNVAQIAALRDEAAFSRDTAPPSMGLIERLRRLRRTHEEETLRDIRDQ